MTDNMSGRSVLNVMCTSTLKLRRAVIKGKKTDGQTK